MSDEADDNILAAPRYVRYPLAIALIVLALYLASPPPSEKIYIGVCALFGVFLLWDVILWAIWSCPALTDSRSLDSQAVPDG